MIYVFSKKIQMLEHLALQKPDKMLTLYLNTDRRNQDQQGGEWKIALKNGLNRLGEYLEISDLDEKKRFVSIREKIEKYISSREREMPRSIILFASDDSGIWETFEMQNPVETSFYWEEHAVLDQIQDIHQQYPLSAFILLQQNQVKVLETMFGELQKKDYYEYDLDTEDWKKHEGPHHADVTMGSGGGNANKKDHFEERVKANQKRWIKSLGSSLDKKAADRKWEKIVLVGEKSTADLLDASMNKHIHEKIQKNLLHENETKVIEELT
ncbi:VLRF1 family aeRF1-type release factor [Metabacillus arenae]|uniref:Protein required for attachment to host cells n=1 Tax=Metabacillus arenae TaxID=2771434 RepID=A0A926N922_9BACI|nr:VLRF1 family aeRF1-type release factor [Metabacillus arenae]MBD1378959.1 hypothetical protein [Metabacillus arenae]